jgi:hypothetical protein
LNKLLDYSPERWLKHTFGVAKLLRFRGADRYTTDFEKALLSQHLGTAVSVAFKDDPSFANGL